MAEFDYIKENYEKLVYEVGEIAKRSGTKIPKIVAVTKSGSDEELLALVKSGATAIGENRPGELRRRYGLLKENSLFPEMHEIGTLQSNKVKLVADIASLIHSLSTESTLKEISKRASALGIKIPVLIEINSAEEPQKDGVLPKDAREFLEKCLATEGIAVKGLMTMGPNLESSEDLRPYFRRTRRLFDELSDEYGFGEEPILSMGMSDSFGVAIEEGSTLIRVGRRLFKKNQEEF